MRPEATRCDRRPGRRQLGASGLASAWLLAAAAPQLAHAQTVQPLQATAPPQSLPIVVPMSYFDRNNNISVTDRPRPEYQAQGIDLSSFQIFPSLTIAPEFDDNIFATSDHKIDDLITSIQPQVRVRSNWSRDEVDAFAELASNVYAAHSTENTTNYSFGGSGRLDILAQSNVNASFSYGQNTIARTAEDTFTTSLAPIQYDSTNFSVGSLQGFSRFQFNESLTFAQTSYQNSRNFDGSTLILTYLNNKNITASGQVNFALTPELALFTRASYNDRPYDNSVVHLPGNNTVTTPDRSSDGFTTSVGADFDITRLIRGDVSLGYLQQDYRSTTFHTVSGPAVNARVEYFLSGLTTVTFTVNRSVIDAVDPTAISYLDTQAALKVDHELLRNVILSARAAYETASYRGEDRNDVRPSLALTGTYLLNRYVGVTVGYTVLDESSSGAARVGSYVVNVASLSLNLQL